MAEMDKRQPQRVLSLPSTFAGSWFDSKPDTAAPMVHRICDDYGAEWCGGFGPARLLRAPSCWT